ncbi:GNAT family N-acetyltransferase [uncultured Algibacter sp.]|uniref:GNAT family N-acetyltransferase n=1 Tax=uncultured Algibacter sp. TaxID=298659 RepID=UPI0026367DCB|nr:GNAT family N-acetyltransferase [uncultured Algibacter sp.]
MDNNLNKVNDITFVGSGISTSFTIINFLNLLDKKKLTHKISINIIDKYSEFNTGIPYGSRSGFSTLLITSLKNFLPEPERTRFINWLNLNKGWLLEAYKEEGGVLTKKWLTDNQAAIENNDWKDLFLPRRFFGIYINERVKNKIQYCVENGLINVNYIEKEVVDIIKNENIFDISIENGNSILSKKVVLSIGSLPVKKLWKELDLIEENNLMFVNSPYSPNLNKTLDTINSFLEKRSEINKKTNVLIIGANASALELLYKLNDNDNSNRNSLNDFMLLSTQGRTPDAIIDEKRKNEFQPYNLNKLQRKGSLSAKVIAKAAFEDINETDKISLGAASTVDTISSAFGTLLTKLESEELKKFACHYGNEIGKKQRCAGVHYTDTIRMLKKEDRFIHLAGRFKDLVLDEETNEYSLRYLDTKTNTEKTFNKKYHLVINCIGGMNLTDNNTPVLLNNLLKNGCCEMNDSKIGLSLNNSLESIPDFHIMGPLVAGNVINNNAVWHVEHCGRIIWLSGLLSKVLYDSISKTNLQKPKLKISDNLSQIESDFEIITEKKDWDLFLKDIGNYDFYHTYDYNKLGSSSTEKPILIKYIENDIIIGLPLIIRDIYSTIYKDATSVYGYVGPVSKGIGNDFDNSNFIKHLKNYFNDNNIISVFSRLNPFIKNQDRILFDIGSLTPQGKVVNIEISKPLEEQRSKYRSRLKTYINKSRKECSIKIANSEKELKTFIDLYYQNMDRVNAKKYYYFSKNYFKQILNSKDFAATILLVIHNKTNKIIGGSIFITTNRIVQYHLSGTDLEYSKLNPTKLLIDEMRIKASQEGKKYFNLGGGLGGSDTDSLFHFKSSFSKDYKQFYLWKWITNKEVYNELVMSKTENKQSDYFPSYRSIEDINVQM